MVTSGDIDAAPLAERKAGRIALMHCFIAYTRYSNKYNYEGRIKLKS